jgi:hypothetical protein
MLILNILITVSLACHEWQLIGEGEQIAANSQAVWITTQQKHPQGNYLLAHFSTERVWITDSTQPAGAILGSNPLAVDHKG